jgi:hypothetical protein
MARVITFSRQFQKKHPRAGEPTYFVEHILNSLNIKVQSSLMPGVREIINDFFMLSNTYQKLHTIRAGNRWKVGDTFSPRVWSGKPYDSKQIAIAPDITIKKIWDIEIFENYEIHINGVWMASFGSENCWLIATNDGLVMVDFINWFDKLPFKGQIICWSDGVEY